MKEPRSQDPFQVLGADAPLRARVWEIHLAVRTFMPFVARVAVSIFDPRTTALRVFVHSSQGESPAPHYHVPADEAPSLRRLLEAARPLVIEERLTFEDAAKGLAARLGRSGFAASYTLPIFSNGEVLGFVFFNSAETDVFSEATVSQLGTFGHLASLLVLQELAAVRALLPAARSGRRERDGLEAGTGSRLDRMSHYVGLIAHALADRAGLDDRQIALLEAYAPLHDIGKNGIPESILLKPDSLTPDEVAVVRTHANRGLAIVEDLITHFGLESLADIDLARNIVLHHHERIDGEGYPHGLSGGSIPLEARIVGAADVFDALTSGRPYREAFSNETALGMLEEAAGEQLDAECVGALAASLAEVERIQAHYPEDRIG